MIFRSIELLFYYRSSWKSLAPKFSQNRILDKLRAPWLSIISNSNGLTFDSFYVSSVIPVDFLTFSLQQWDEFHEMVEHHQKVSSKFSHPSIATRNAPNSWRSPTSRHTWRLIPFCTLTENREIVAHGQILWKSKPVWPNWQVHQKYTQQ